MIIKSSMIVREVEKVIFSRKDTETFTYGKEYVYSKASSFEDNIFVINNYGVWVICDKFDFLSLREFREKKLKNILNE